MDRVEHTHVRGKICVLLPHTRGSQQRGLGRGSTIYAGARDARRPATRGAFARPLPCCLPLLVSLAQPASRRDRLLKSLGACLQHSLAALADRYDLSSLYGTLFILFLLSLLSFFINV
jgi:hypothetical protein